MKIAVIGAGLMGRGIAQVLIQNQVETYLIDINEEILSNAKNEIQSRLNREIEKKCLTKEKLQEVLTKLHLLSSIEEGISKVNMIIECIPEKLELKKQIIQIIQQLNTEIIVASNTSSLSIDQLAENSINQQNIIGMHWFNPPVVMKLVEIVVGTKTSDKVVKKIYELAKMLSKEPIIVKDYPGFASSRLGVVLGLEAIRMLEQNVASVSDIDKAMTLGYRHPMGPLELTDYIGLDTRLHIAEYLNENHISPAFEIPELLRTMVNEGKLGRKSGLGFYRWEDGKAIKP